MATGAWEALASLSSVSELRAVLLSAPLALPEPQSSIAAKVAATVKARLGPCVLTHYEQGVPARRLRGHVLAELPPEAFGSVQVVGYAILWRGGYVALRDFAPVELTPQSRFFSAALDWHVTSYGGEPS